MLDGGKIVNKYLIIKTLEIDNLQWTIDNEKLAIGGGGAGRAKFCNGQWTIGGEGSFVMDNVLAQAVWNYRRTGKLSINSKFDNEPPKMAQKPQN
ncbi:MAG: hypothetical protein MI921_20435 [Cytophagales bacterium]|nr:hypothetical protein [Cytophagales bacterium]